MVLIIATTRFNNQTFQENKRWRETNLPNGCIYKVPIQIATTIPQGARLFVLEMNNTTNQIEGIGYTIKQLRYDYPAPIYEDRTYNRYTYVGRHRINREDLLKKNEFILKELEDHLFKGKGNMKRGQSITRLPRKRCLPQYYEYMMELFNLDN